MPDSARPFPRSWTVTRTAGGYSILDADHRAVAFFYFVENVREAASDQPLSPNEGRRVAEAISAVGGSSADLACI
jgi:hypothetical protein